MRSRNKFVPLGVVCRRGAYTLDRVGVRPNPSPSRGGGLSVPAPLRTHDFAPFFAARRRADTSGVARPGRRRPPPASRAVARLPPQHDPQLDEADQGSGHAPPDRRTRGPALLGPSGQLGDSEPGSLGADDQLGVEEVGHEPTMAGSVSTGARRIIFIPCVSETESEKPMRSIEPKMAVTKRRGNGRSSRDPDAASTPPRSRALRHPPRAGPAPDRRTELVVVDVECDDELAP